VRRDSLFLAADFVIGLFLLFMGRGLYRENQA
jgi:hypothetical protein